MFSFNAVVFASLLGSAAASFEKIHTFRPKTSVTDHYAISFDQLAMELELAGKSNPTFAAAKKVYQEGGFSKAVADIVLADPGLPYAIPKNTLFTGTAVDGSTITARSFASYPTGATTITLQYSTTDLLANYNGCRVGGLPADAHLTDGCFSEAQGSTVILDGYATPLVYTYSVTDNNDNERTIQGFSTKANAKYRPGEDLSQPYFDDFQVFFDYYGAYDYADRFVLGGIDGTNVQLTNGNWDFSQFDFSGRAEIAKKASAYMNVAMYVIRELEDAIFDCDETCAVGECNDDPSVHALDEAVAFYTGAVFAEDPNGLGNFHFGLAQKRCLDFGTCADGREGEAKVNSHIFDLFDEMQDNLVAGRCPEAEAQVDAIARQMWVPLIQGTLRYAYILENELNPTDKAKAEGAIFAASVLPVIATCNADAADTIYTNMKPGAQSVSFRDVKASFESTYGCIGITCRDVGGVVKNDNAYEDGAGPCGGVFTLGDGGSSASGLAIGSLVAASISALLVFMM